MENAVVSGRRDEEGALDARKLPIMRALARLHECDLDALCGTVDASELDVHDILTMMVSESEVEASTESRRGRFALTLKGWGEYMRVLGSVYELTE